MGVSKIDANSRGSLTAVSNVDGTTIVPLWADPVTHRLLTSATSTTNIIVGTSTITSGSNGKILYDNNGVVGELTNNFLTSLSGAVLTTTNQSVAGIKTFSDATEATNTTTGGTIISGGLAVAKRVYALDMTVTNAITGSVTGNAGTATSATTAGSVTNATLTTALTVNTGTVTLTGNVANTSVLTIGAGAVSVSGSNTGDNTVATALTGTPSITVNTVTTTGDIELGNASDTTIHRGSPGVVYIEGVQIDTVTNAVTLTNKRITPRIYTTTSLAGTPGTLTPEINTYDYFELTAQAAALNIANMSTSTPTGGEKMIIAITSDATPRALTYGTAYVAKGGVALPSTTVASKTTTLGFIFNAGLAKWNLVAVAQEA